jgi:hypothetical protein
VDEVTRQRQRLELALRACRGQLATQGETIMTQAMLSIGNALIAQSATRGHGTAVAQKAIGLAIAGSGLALIVAHGLQFALPG